MALLAVTALGGGVDAHAGMVGGAVGTVETLAGPGFCEGRSVLDPSSLEVRALAVDPGGRIFFDTGPRERARIARVDGNLAQTVSGGRAVAPDPLAAGPSEADSGDGFSAEAAGGGGGAPSPASRLAPDRNGGVFIGAGPALVHLADPKPEDRPPGVDPTAPEAIDGPETVAGDPAGGAASQSTGDGGPAAAARFTQVASVASDEAGNAYVADVIDLERRTVRIRAVNRTEDPLTFYAGTPHEVTIAPGAIDTIAGADGPGNAGDGGPAKEAVIAGVPPAMAVAGGRLYTASYRPARDRAGAEARVRVVNLGGEALVAQGVEVGPGAIETVAGNGVAGFSGDGGQARNASFSYLPGIGADGHNLFLADTWHHRIRRIDPSGTISTFAGIGDTGPDDGGFNGNGRPAVEARLDHPYDVDVASNGLVYVSDPGNAQVRFVDGTGLIHVAPGAGAGATWACAQEGGGLQLATPGLPTAVAVQSGAGLYFLTSRPARLKHLDSTGAVVTVPTPGAEAPVAMAARPAGGLYLVTSDPPAVHFLNLDDEPVTVHGVSVDPRTTAKVAGSEPGRRGGEGGRALDAAVLPTSTVVADAEGNLYITANDGVRQVDDEGAITTVVSPTPAFSGRCCAAPWSSAVDGAGNLYVLDRSFSPVVWFLSREVRPMPAHGHVVEPGQLTAVAGKVVSEQNLASVAELVDAGRVQDEGGPATEASFIEPRSIVVDPHGNLFIADTGGGAANVIRRVDVDGAITTVAGGNNRGFNGDGLAGALTVLGGPSQLAFDRCGNLLFAETNSDRIRRLNLVPCAAANAADHDTGGRRIPWALVVAGAGVVVLVVGAAVVLRRSG